MRCWYISEYDMTTYNLCSSSVEMLSYASVHFLSATRVSNVVDFANDTTTHRCHGSGTRDVGFAL